MAPGSPFISVSCFTSVPFRNACSCRSRQEVNRILNPTPHATFAFNASLGFRLSTMMALSAKMPSPVTGSSSNAFVGIGQVACFGLQVAGHSVGAAGSAIPSATSMAIADSDRFRRQNVLQNRSDRCCSIRIEIPGPALRLFLRRDDLIAPGILVEVTLQTVAGFARTENGSQVCRSRFYECGKWFSDRLFRPCRLSYHPYNRKRAKPVFFLPALIPPLLERKSQ